MRQLHALQNLQCKAFPHSAYFATGCNIITAAGPAGCTDHPHLHTGRRVENEDREPDQSLLAALESYSRTAVGSNWGAAVDAELVANLGKYRRYDYTCLRDLLRVIRNKRNHFREMPDSLQSLMGPIPDGFYRCV
jgi:hypothetical protein